MFDIIKTVVALGLGVLVWGKSATILLGLGMLVSTCCLVHKRLSQIKALRSFI